MGWAKGVSGNPAGRKKGIPDRRTQARELFAEHKDGLIATAIRLAMGGDATALRLCLDRVVPALKPTGPSVLLPALPRDLAGQGQRVMAHVAAGELSPDEAATIMGSLAALARITEISDLERRVAALEGATGAAG